MGGVELIEPSVEPGHAAPPLQLDHQRLLSERRDVDPR